MSRSSATAAVAVEKNILTVAMSDPLLFTLVRTSSSRPGIGSSRSSRRARNHRRHTPLVSGQRPGPRDARCQRLEGAVRASQAMTRREVERWQP
jgi:hypothetical protein